MFFFITAGPFVLSATLPLLLSSRTCTHPRRLPLFALRQEEARQALKEELVAAKQQKKRAKKEKRREDEEDAEEASEVQSKKKKRKVRFA